ncbi:unnamed protein product [Urochloa humidicola]
MSPPPHPPLAGPSWDTMMLDILLVVLCNLPCVADRACFAAVCRHWRSAAARLAKTTTAPPAQLPWLVFPSPAVGSAVSTVFCLLSGTTRRIYLPADLAGACLCGSHPGGWLVGAAQAPGGGNTAANLFSRETVPLPGEQQLIRQRPEGPQLEEDLLIHAVTFSDAPSAPGCVAAFLTRSHRIGIALCSLGLDGNGTPSWTLSKNSFTYCGIEDLVYFENGVVPGFHKITKNECVSVVRTNDTRIARAFMSRVQWQEDDVFKTLPDSVHISRYLVVSRGRLLMIRRYFTLSGSNNVRQTLLFRVFQCEINLVQNVFEQYLWVELEGCLDGRALFLGRGCSRACELPPNSRIKEGNIYFLDDIGCDEALKLQDSSRYNGMDMGVYSMQEPKPPSLIVPTQQPDPSSSFAAQKIVACIKHEGKLEIKLFENWKELEAYVEEKPDVEVKIKGSIQRFISEPTSKCPPPIWLFH